MRGAADVTAIVLAMTIMTTVVSCISMDPKFGTRKGNITTYNDEDRRKVNDIFEDIFDTLTENNTSPLLVCLLPRLTKPFSLFSPSRRILALCRH